MPSPVNGVQIGTMLSVNFMTNMQKLHRGIWPWTVGLKSRLPLHYKQRYIEKFMREPQAVHYYPDTRKYAADKHGCPVRVQNVPIPVIFPKEADNGLWGGEGLVAGFKKKNDNSLKPRVAYFWKPYLSKHVVYSEILNHWMAVTVTRRTLDLINAANGFDNYILETHEVDMHSKLGMKLKREMLLTLAHKTMYPDDKERCEAVYRKYEKYVIPAEEAEWVGLTLYEAERKQHRLEEAERIANIRPLKDLFADDLAKELLAKRHEDSSEKSWLDKFNPFRDQKA